MTHRAAPDLKAAAPAASHRAAPQLKTQVTQSTQTTGFLNEVQQQLKADRAVLRGRKAGQDAEIQTQLLADRQILQSLLMKRHPDLRVTGQTKMNHSDTAEDARRAAAANWQSGRSSKWDSLSSGRSAAQAYDLQAYESLLGMCNMYEEQLHSAYLAVADMGERIDNVYGYERVIENLKATHAKEVAQLADLVRRKDGTLAWQQRELDSARAAEVKVLCRETESLEVQVERLRNKLRKEEAQGKKLSDKLDVSETRNKKLRSAFASCILRMNRLLAENSDLIRLYRAASQIQSQFRRHKFRRDRAARVIQRLWLARRAARAEEEARLLAEKSKKLERELETQRMLARTTSRAAALSTDLNSEKMRKLEDEAAATKAALDAASRLTMRDGTAELPIREGIAKLFGTAFVKAAVENLNKKMRDKPGGGVGKYAEDVGTLILGDPSAAALGLWSELKVDMFELFGLMATGVGAIVHEIETSGTEVDKECLDYVLNQRAGSSPKLFVNSPFARDCDANGVRDDRKTDKGEGMLLEDFMLHEHSQTAHLKAAHVVAIRLYSTAAFMSLNGPLRDKSRTTPHPFASTIFFLADGIKKLRTVEADREKKRVADAHAGKRWGSTISKGEKDRATSMDLWRGMKNLKTAKEFLEKGGSESALMSTTSNPTVAVGYSLSTSSLIFKIRTDSFMQRGADISWLSAFPAEAEFLYPPLVRCLLLRHLLSSRHLLTSSHPHVASSFAGVPFSCADVPFSCGCAECPSLLTRQTFLKPTGKKETVKVTPRDLRGVATTLMFTVIEVEPQMA